MRYHYSSRPHHLDNLLCLDFNEYQGDIHHELYEQLIQTPWPKHYPCTDDFSIENAIAQQFNLNFENIFLTNGADDGLFHIFLSLKIKNDLKIVGISQQPTYDHVQCFSSSLKYQTTSDIKDSEIVYLCTPNNPTGDQMGPEVVESLIHQYPQKIWVLDLTYGFYSNYSMVEYIKLSDLHDNLIIVFSLSKSFPLAGARMGVVVTNNKSVKFYFENEYNKKTVNSISRYLTKECLNYFDFYQDQRLQIWKNRWKIQSVVESLARVNNIQMASLPMEKSGGNFILFGGNRDELEKMNLLLKSLRILVRLKNNWNFIRVTSCNDTYYNQYFKRLETSQFHQDPIYGSH